MSGKVIPLRGRGRAVPGTYLVARISDPCPNCGAQPHEYCKRPDGQPRRMPCLARMNREQKPSGPY